ncbi:MAG: TIGR04211 family SH3 domain-containing protein, partial [Desulfohalobiaceae bacterium]|nr:TIGR04211 family SH3 domain-containing protein [Desulfohalobiaceae bacterium]
NIILKSGELAPFNTTDNPMPLKVKLLACLIFLALWIAASPCAAQAVYVADHFRITLRARPAQNARIVAMLDTGAKLEVLEEREHWLRVRTGQDQTGWILKRFSMERLPHEQVVQRLRERIDRLEEETSQASRTIETLQKTKSRLTAELKDTNQTLQRVREKYAKLQSEVPDLPKIKQALQTTRNELQTSRERVQKLEQENQSLRSRNTQLWFLAGAGTVFVSCFIGFILGRIRRKKPRSVYF